MEAAGGTFSFPGNPGSLLNAAKGLWISDQIIGTSKDIRRQMGLLVAYVRPPMSSPHMQREDMLPDAGPIRCRPRFTDPGEVVGVRIGGELREDAVQDPENGR